ncbi:hypothetical protein NE237_000948 [Protea cynaroides]|uniref:Uncharacterized protein n=1 Tax=Protea cynaroides TaxID=273540 RepID=A0A9Q0KSD1_9MAGN|nr:hypothetical protein NE237_000948 [Protea cynaroides]
MQREAQKREGRSNKERRREKGGESIATLHCHASGAQLLHQQSSSSLPHSTAILLEPNSITQLQPSHTPPFFIQLPTSINTHRCSQEWRASRNHPLFAIQSTISLSRGDLVPSKQSRTQRTVCCPESAPNNILRLANSLILSKIRAQQHLAPSGQSDFVQNPHLAASHDHLLSAIRIQQHLATISWPPSAVQQHLTSCDHLLAAICSPAISHISRPSPVRDSRPSPIRD